MMDEGLQKFMYKNLPIRTVLRDGAVWFSATDVCRVLGLDNASRACERLKDHEKGITTVHTLGGDQSSLFITESGMYKLVFTSRKPEAEAFTDWVASDVLPAIRRQGFYVAPAPEPSSAMDLIIMGAENMSKLAQYTKALEERVNTHEDEIVRLWENADTESAAINERITLVGNVETNPNDRQKLNHLIGVYAREVRLPYPKAWKAFKKHYNWMYRTNVALLKSEWAGREGLDPKDVTLPEYLEASGALPNALLVLDAMIQRKVA